jgi:hypothetical protein
MADIDRVVSHAQHLARLGQDEAAMAVAVDLAQSSRFNPTAFQAVSFQQVVPLFCLEAVQMFKAIVNNRPRIIIIASNGSQTRIALLGTKCVDRHAFRRLQPHPDFQSYRNLPALAGSF